MLQAAFWDLDPLFHGLGPEFQITSSEEIMEIFYVETLQTVNPVGLIRQDLAGYNARHVHGVVI